MLVILKHKIDSTDLDNLIGWLKEHDLEVTVLDGLLMVKGDTYKVDDSILRSFEIVESVQRLGKQYHLADRDSHPEDTVIQVGDITIGGGNFTMIAGPCTIESKNMLIDIAARIKVTGAQILRGGAFKPRSSPYSFQGLGEEAIDYLANAGKEIGMPTITEIMDVSQIEMFTNIDILQVGSKNMQNFELLKALGKVGKPVLLKRGLSSSINDLLMSAEYILANGNPDVILCERGIRTFETATRNTLDLAAVPLLKKLTHLPVIVDPSHATGISSLVPPMSLAAVACGADGLMIEVHNDPVNALCDGPQAISPDEFKILNEQIECILPYKFR